jgi:hypothetical protein
MLELCKCRWIVSFENLSENGYCSGVQTSIADGLHMEWDFEYS